MSVVITRRPARPPRLRWRGTFAIGIDRLFGFGASTVTADNNGNELKIQSPGPTRAVPDGTLAGLSLGLPTTLLAESRAGVAFASAVAAAERIQRIAGQRLMVHQDGRQILGMDHGRQKVPFGMGLAMV